MNIEQKVTSLELSKQLKEAGFPQRTAFYWWRPNFTTNNWCIEYWQSYPGIIDDRVIAAPLPCELGEMLPSQLNDGSYWELHKIDENEWQLGYGEIHSNLWVHHVEADTEADARAKMWLYLKEKGLIK